MPVCIGAPRGGRVGVENARIVRRRRFRGNPLAAALARWYISSTHRRKAMPAIGRRTFLGTAAACAAAPLAAAERPPRRPRVAAVYTVFHHRSHAHVILEKFLRPYLFNGRRTDPGVDVVAFYADQTAREGDMTQEVARQFKVPVYRSIAEALCRGGKELAVDAVLSIGEHGEYPRNKLGQV